MAVKKAVKKIISSKLEVGSSALEKNLPSFKLIVASFTLNASTLVLTLVFQNSLPPEIPLFYGFPDGASQLAQREFLFLPASVALGVTIINTGFAFFIKDSFMKHILIFSSLLITILSTITALKIFFLVGNI